MVSLMSLFEFPPWTNKIRMLAGAGLGGGVFYILLIVTFGFSPKTTDVGYMPEQPIPFSHALHAGEMGMDCRYCHQTVEQAAHAAVPSTETCMACHSNVALKSEKLKPLHKSWETNTPVEWIRVHDLPDYVYFDHSAHLHAGVGCVSCHGRIDQMEVVYQEEPLSMGWCLDCHRNPEPNLRPKHAITQMDWVSDDPGLGARLREAYNVNPREDCSTCHR